MRVKGLGSGESFAPELPLSGSLLAIGVDVLALERLSEVLTRSPRLFRRVCSAQERLEWIGVEGASLAWAAGLWVTKEASVKCLGTGFWREGVDWPDLDVGGRRATALCVERDALVVEEEEVWGAWRPWSEVHWSAPQSAAPLGAQLLCCARIERRFAWGYAYLVAPD